MQISRPSPKFMIRRIGRMSVAELEENARARAWLIPSL